MQISPQKSAPTEVDLQRKARELESVFLAEMLRAAKLGESRQGFGGGAGEDAFAGLLVAEQARILAEGGGVGLAESIFRAMAAGRDNA